MMLPPVQPSTSKTDVENPSGTSQAQARFKLLKYTVIVGTATAIGGFFGGLKGYLLSSNSTDEEQTDIATAYIIKGALIASSFTFSVAVFTCWLMNGKPETSKPEPITTENNAQWWERVKNEYVVIDTETSDTVSA